MCYFFVNVNYFKHLSRYYDFYFPSSLNPGELQMENRVNCAGTCHRMHLCGISRGVLRTMLSSSLLSKVFLSIYNGVMFLAWVSVRVFLRT